MLKRQNGITLIALVVTIIVLLILAGVSITMVAGDNGIATKARKSAEATEIGTIKEDIKLEVSEKYTENLGILTEDEFVTILESYGTLSDEENVLDKTLTTDPDKTDTSKSYEIKVSDLYNGSFGGDNSEEDDETITYTVTFIAYDNSTASDTVYETKTVNSGEKVTKPENPPTKDGDEGVMYYVFREWVTENGGETPFDFENTTISENVTLYARYEAVVCFVAGTKVLTENGLLNIEDVQVGMNVYSYNEETKIVELKEVKQTFINDVDFNMCKVTANGTTVESTSGHEYYTVNRGWIDACELEVGDVLLDNNNEEKIVEKVEIVESNGNITTVYNFEVEDNHNYYVGENKVLVHNTGGSV